MMLAGSVFVVVCAAGCRGPGKAGRLGPGPARLVLDGHGHYGPAFERGKPVTGKLVLSRPAAGELVIRVSDSLGRLLVDTRQPVRRKATEIPFRIVVPGVVAMRHTISVALHTPQTVLGGGADFLHRPPAIWDDYVCTIWHRHNAARLPHLQKMYLTGSQWSSASPTPPEHFIRANYRYYLEHGTPWIFSPYHMWFPDRAKTYYFKQAVHAFVKDRTNLRLLERNPCISNPFTAAQIKETFTRSALVHRDLRPLFYTVADEPGVANQAAPFDFCFSPYCQAGFRAWLRKRYGTLNALNRQWGTTHRKWDDVRGATTDETFARDDDNFSAWCDHKEFMDDVLIGGYALAGKAMKRADRAGRIGMGGAQGPTAVGGWDFWKLCQTFDVLEAYYIGNNYELMRSFAPDLIPVHCSFGSGNPEKHLIWYLFIHGDRGLLVWDGGAKYVNDRGRYSARAREARDWYRELTGGIGKLRITSRRVDDPVALYHSQANLRVHWVQEVRPHGERWVHRNSSAERIRSRYVRLRESWVKLIEDNGFQYRFLCSAQVARGDLRPYDARTGQGFKLLFLPEIEALSTAEADAIRAFVKAGGAVVADKLPGAFDEHGKRRKVSPLAGLFGESKRAILLNQDMLPYYRQRLYPQGDESLKMLIGKHLVRTVAGDQVTPRVVGDDGQPVTGVEVTVWRNGAAELIALHRNPQLRVHELGPQEYRSNKKFEVPAKVKVSRPGVTTWYDVRAGRKLGQRKEVTVTVPPFEPAFLVALRAAAKPFDAHVETGAVSITPGKGCPLESPAYHLDFLGPDRKERLVYRVNVVCPPDGGSFPLPLALNDASGTWTLRVREVATGETREVTFGHRP
jgi:hypothetical protein